MPRGLSVGALLKSVIAVLAAVVVVVLALGAWSSWNRLLAVQRIAAVADASASLFQVLHNLRLDGSITFRDLMQDKLFTAMDPQVRKAREAEMPAFKSTLVALPRIDFPGRESVLSGLEQAYKRLTALQEEAAAAYLQPKAARRAGLAQEYLDQANSLLRTLNDLAARLTALVKLDDGFVDHLFELKQLAWDTRNAGGDTSVMVSNGLGGQVLPPDAMTKYFENVGKLMASWAALEELASGLPLPARFVDAVAKAKREYFGGDYAELRLKTLKALIEGRPPGITVQQWSPMSVGKLASLLGVAEAALDAAKDYAAVQHDEALWKLALQLALLAGALALAGAMMWVVSARVSRPLRRIQDAMLKVAGGDLSVEVSFAGRNDEIGALGNALQVFKDSRVEADRLRAEQGEAETRTAAQRKIEMRNLADEFEAAVGHIVTAVSSAATELEAAADTLTKTAERTQQLSGIVTSASEDASANVQSVASATDEMAASVNEIARQVSESSRIAGEAVNQAGRTDARITELSNAASRIGDVVKLITAIAEQTNLLALNATIEAARAGEAGKGFAVVAQEVKALAAQTAKATEEIGAQISSMQSATRDSVGAIKEIGGTIGRIAEIAGAIAAAVEEQGAATKDISRSVQQAAQGTAQVATNILDVNHGASETGSASAQVLGSAKSLARESGQLKLEVEKFVHMVRTA